MSSVPTFKYGYVVGRFINSKGDADDLDRLPDVVGAKLSPTFTRVRGQYVQPLDEPEFGIHGAMVYHEPVVTGVTDQGFLTGDVDSTGKPLADAKPGVWLVTGRYRVSLGSQFPSMEIEVLESHTEDDPLDLSTEQEYVPPPGVIVNTLPLPSGGEPGQVYGWTGSSVGWYTPEEGPSAYEVALRNGFSGTVDAWLLSLKGEAGISAYEVALSQGFSGTIDEWLVSLKGLKGDPGFSAYQLAKTNGFSGTVTEWLDSLVGRQGDPGPANQLDVIETETVSSDTPASVTISGEAPSQHLSFSIPKGARGEKGDTGSPTEYILVGPGRPDVPSTTAGVITGAEPVGGEYRSTDGASVGAFVWMKRPGGKWEVTGGDTGWRRVTRASLAAGAQFYRRTQAGVSMGFGGGSYDSFTAQGSSSGGTLASPRESMIVGKGETPAGFGPFKDILSILTRGARTFLGYIYCASAPGGDQGLVRFHYTADYTSDMLLRTSTVTYLTAEAWPSTLPGTPA